MVLYNTTCGSLIERVCRTVLNDWKSGTATGGSTTTIIDTVRRDEADDYFQNTTPISYARILTTTDNLAPKGEERKATDFANTTATLTVAPAFSAAPAAGDTYVITHMKRWAELLEYLNMAIDMVKAEAYLPKIDETTMIVQSDTYEYPLPLDFTHVYRVTQGSSDGGFDNAPVDPNFYKIIRAADTPLLHFIRASEGLGGQDHYYGDMWFGSDATADRYLRIEGLGMQEKLVNDTDICYLNPNFVVAQAGAFIHASLVRRSDNEPDAHQTQFQVWQTIADDIRKSRGFQTMMPPNCKRVR